MPKLYLLLIVIRYANKAVCFKRVLPQLSCFGVMQLVEIALLLPAHLEQVFTIANPIIGAFTAARHLGDFQVEPVRCQETRHPECGEFGQHSGLVRIDTRREVFPQSTPSTDPRILSRVTAFRLKIDGELSFTVTILVSSKEPPG